MHVTKCREDSNSCFTLTNSALKVMTGQWSLVDVKAFVTVEKPCRMVTMTATK